MEERRYYGLDALRGVMMMLGIVLHAAAMYVTVAPPGLPLVADPDNSPLMDILVAFIHSFRMPTFFVLAGFFAALLVERRGLWGTYKNRAARILGPLAAGIVTVLPISLVLFADFAIARLYGVHRIVPALQDLERLERDMLAAGAPTGIPLGHLWFLYYLLYFYLLIPVCRFLGARSGLRRPRLWALWIVLSLITAATLWPFPGGQVFGDFLFLKPYLPGLLYYGFFFVAGYMLYYHRGLLDELARTIPRHLVLALVLFPLALIGTHAAWTGFGPQWAAVVSNAFLTWALTFLFIGCAMRFFGHASPWSLYASQSAYWVFLVHMPIVCLVAWWLLPVRMPGVAKVAVNLAVTSVLCFATYHYLVQRTWISVFLNGKRFDLDWPWRKTGTYPPSGNPP